MPVQIACSLKRTSLHAYNMPHVGRTLSRQWRRLVLTTTDSLHTARQSVRFAAGCVVSHGVSGSNKQKKPPSPFLGPLERWAPIRYQVCAAPAGAAIRIERLQSHDCLFISVDGTTILFATPQSMGVVHDWRIR